MPYTIHVKDQRLAGLDDLRTQALLGALAEEGVLLVDVTLDGGVAADGPPSPPPPLIQLPGPPRDADGDFPCWLPHRDGGTRFFVTQEARDAHLAREHAARDPGESRILCVCGKRVEGTRWNQHVAVSKGVHRPADQGGVDDGTPKPGEEKVLCSCGHWYRKSFYETHLKQHADHSEVGP